MEKNMTKAFQTLLHRVFNGNVPDNYFDHKVHGVYFDKCRREVEREFRMFEWDDDSYMEWTMLLMMNSPAFYTEEELANGQAQTG